MEVEEKVIAVSAGILLVAGFASMLTGGRPQQRVTGCSLRLENTPPDAAWWAADFPFSEYQGSIGFTGVSEPGWLLTESPGLDTVRIVFLNADYQCIASDPVCQGFTFTVELLNGLSYVLDVATGELTEDPNPPFTPDLPALENVNIPSGKAGGKIWPEVTVYLPTYYPGQQHWGYNLSVVTGEPGFDEPVPSLITLASASLVSPGLLASILEENRRPFVPLDAEDGRYTFRGAWDSSSENPDWAASTIPDIATGSYPVILTLSNAYAITDDVSIGVSVLQQFEFGFVGTLEVTE